MEHLSELVSHFRISGHVADIKALGNGLINDTFKVTTAEASEPDYVLQRINNAVFQDVDLLQHNIGAVTGHIRAKLQAAGEDDIERKVLEFIPTVEDGSKTYYTDGTGYWRMMKFIPRTVTHETVNPEFSYHAGKAFGQFQAMLADIKEDLGETIPDFHNIEFRLKQLREAVENAGHGSEMQKTRLTESESLIKEIEDRAEAMTVSERLHREGKLPKRICHCDTKVNNMLFDENGKVLCVIDLDTVMPSFVFSDYGDFLRTGACTAAEDEPDTSRVGFDMEIFKAFTKGYMESAGEFLTQVEIDHLPYAVTLFPYMQAVRFLADYLNGDTYYKTKYPEHNLVRTKAQFKLLQCTEAALPEMKAYISGLK